MSLIYCAKFFQKNKQLSALLTVENIIITCNLCQFHRIFNKAFQTCSVRCARQISLSFSERRKTRSPERSGDFLNFTQLQSLNPSKLYSFHLNLEQSQDWFSLIWTLAFLILTHTPNLPLTLKWYLFFINSSAASLVLPFFLLCSPSLRIFQHVSIGRNNKWS